MKKIILTLMLMFALGAVIAEVPDEEWEQERKNSGIITLRESKPNYHLLAQKVLTYVCIPCAFILLLAEKRVTGKRDDD